MRVQLNFYCLTTPRRRVFSYLDELENLKVEDAFPVISLRFI